MLAHERVLQALIAYMARTEPHFIDHLNERFVEPMRMAQHENDFPDTADYAEQFIRAVMRLEAVRAPFCSEPKAAHQQTSTPTSKERSHAGGESPARETGICVCDRNGIWSVTTNGEFHGDYYRKSEALDAAALLNLARR
ncbi:MAG: hypothetical protein GVY06_02270 [Alphaproteobacteria bacterium]|nr:hypothetical protein [Alphaproteobacteria bacterium]